MGRNCREGRASPLGSIHQELQLAKARDPSLFGARELERHSRLDVGGGVFTAKLGQGNTELPIDDTRLTLGEVHARWQSGPFDLSGLYTRGTISDTRAFNLTFARSADAGAEIVLGRLRARRVARARMDRSYLAPFVRYEQFNTAASYEAQPQGLGAAAMPTSACGRSAPTTI